MLDGSTCADTDTSFSTWPMTRDSLHARFIRRKREQSAWDAEESRDLRIAESLQLWTHHGCVTIIEYLEVFCGIEPRTALERVRVSLALADLPLLEAELEAGTYQFSHVKELTRILVAETEEEWVHHTRTARSNAQSPDTYAATGPRIRRNPTSESASSVFT